MAMNTLTNAFELYDASCDTDGAPPTPDYLRGYAMGAFGIKLSKSLAHEICQPRIRYEAVWPWEPQRYRVMVEEPLAAIKLVKPE